MGGVRGRGWRPGPQSRVNYRAFYEGGRAGTARDGATTVDPYDAIAGLAVIEAARESAATERVVSRRNHGRDAYSLHV